MTHIKTWLIQFGTWAENNYLALVYLAAALILPLLFLLCLSLLYGYWSNGLWGTHFELSVGFSGVSVLATAAATVYGIARAGNIKYRIDSELNSKQGEAPLKNTVQNTVQASVDEKLGKVR